MFRAAREAAGSVPPSGFPLASSVTTWLESMQACATAVGGVALRSVLRMVTDFTVALPRCVQPLDSSSCCSFPSSSTIAPLATADSWAARRWDFGSAAATRSRNPWTVVVASSLLSAPSGAVAEATGGFPDGVPPTGAAALIVSWAEAPRGAAPAAASVGAGKAAQAARPSGRARAADSAATRARRLLRGGRGRPDVSSAGGGVRKDFVMTSSQRGEHAAAPRSGSLDHLLYFGCTGWFPRTVGCLRWRETSDYAAQYPEGTRT